MNELSSLSEIFAETWQKIAESFVNTAPKVLLAIGILVFGWLLAKFVAFLVEKSLKLIRFDGLMKKIRVGQFLEAANIKKSPAEIFGKFVYWTILLLVLVGFSETLGWTMVSLKIGEFINYIPNIIIALLILIAGMYVAQVLRELISNTFQSYAIRTGKMVGNIVYYLLVVVICLTVLDQLQMDVQLLTTNVIVLIGGVALAFAIGYGLSAKEIFPNMISSYYGKNLFSVGQMIRIGESEGEIISITRLSVIINTDEGRKVIPARKLITEEVDIIESD